MSHIFGVALLIAHALPQPAVQAHLTPLPEDEAAILAQLVVLDRQNALTPASLAPLLQMRHARYQQARLAFAARRRPPAPSPPAWSGTPGVEQWRPLVVEHFPADQVDTAMRVMACESTGNPSAKNPRSTAAGLWQFIRSTWDWVAGVLGLPTYAQGGPYDPVGSTRAAAWLQANGGWQHWECY